MGISFSSPHHVRSCALLIHSTTTPSIIIKSSLVLVVVLETLLYSFDTPGFSQSYFCGTVEPPNKGHFGDNISFVLYGEVVLFSEVLNVLEL